ncbi:MAG TPA: EamA family transporter [Burkholderiales bacterium]|nr:EamA family transporter [Burkholderiales bacterium]
MTAFALALILAAAVVHAGWNYLLKRSGGGTVFVWLFAALSALIYAPLAAAILWWQKPGFGWMHYGLMFASAALHTAYYTLLDRGYRSGDLSIVYPIARGTGPLVTVLVAVLLLGERPTALAVAGAALIGCGAVLLAGDPRRLRNAGALPAIGYALLTGCAIAAYTVVDKIAVAAWLIPPLVQDWAANLGRVLLMTPAAIALRREIPRTWRRARREVIAVALLCPLSYILVLTAMVFTPVSYVAPAREVSILVGAWMGTQLLAEGDVARRLAAAAAMVAGIVCLAAG